jgi:hypothetical protein
LKPVFEGLWNYGAGLVLGSFEDTRFRSEYKSSALEKVELIGLGVGKELQDQISRTVYQSAGVILARQLVNSPANVLTPSKYAFPFSSNHFRRMYIIYLLAVFQADKHLLCYGIVNLCLLHPSTNGVQNSWILPSTSALLHVSQHRLMKV